MLSLPDWAFYPLAATAAAGMILVAVSFGDNGHRTAEEIRAEGIVFEGEALTALTLGNGLEAEFLTENGLPFARVTAARGPLDGMQSAGAFFSLSQDETEALRGHRLRVTFSLRQSDTDGAETSLINLFMPDRGQGQWESVDLSPTFSDHELDIPIAPCEWPQAYVAIWPAWASSANTVDLASVRVTALESTPCD